MSDDAVFGGFYGSLAATLVALAAALVLAHKHQPKGHIAAVAVFVLGLLATLFFAETLGARFDFPATSRNVHLPLAFAATAALFAPMITGVLFYTGRLRRDVHVWAARVFLVLAVAAIGTGFWMLSGRTPKAPAPAAGAPG